MLPATGSECPRGLPARRYPARTAGVQDGRPLLADGTVVDVANVIWCTGFRPDFGWIELPVVGEDGWPQHYRGVAASAPGLYFLGLKFLYAFASMLVLGGPGAMPDTWSTRSPVGAPRNASLILADQRRRTFGRSRLVGPPP